MKFAIAIFAVLICVNVLASRRVAKYGDDLGNRKTLLLIGIWLIPFIGALIARDHARPPLEIEHDSGKASPGSSAAGSMAPVALTGSTVGDFDVAAHIARPNGIPILDWTSLKAWVRSSFEEAQVCVAIEQGRRAWLLHMAEAIGPDAHLYESEQSFILSTLEPRVVKAMAEYVTTTRRRIATVLQNVADFPPNEKHILLVLDSEEDYYHYVSIYYPDEGEFAVSGGMFVDAGCPHFVAVRADLSAIEPVIAHEMTHLALSRLRLPKWLDEGIAVNTEQRLAGAKRLLFTPHELHQKHLNFWNPERIQEFWSGKSFDRTDDGNLLSYELARIIVEQLAKQWESFSCFVTSAAREDAGAAAAKIALAINLGTLAAALLEVPADSGWAPDPESWAAAEAKQTAIERQE